MRIPLPIGDPADYEGGMSRLVPPTVGVHRSFLAAMAEFRAEGRGGPDDATVIGHDLGKGIHPCHRA
jgi:hypothetical protein